MTFHLKRPATDLDLWAAFVVAIPVIGAFATPMSAIDLAYHVRTGDLIRATWSIPSTDPFTMTAGGQPWLDQQWGAQVFFSLVFAIGGWLGLALLRAALVGLLFGLVYATCREAGAGRRFAGILTLLSLLVAIPALPLRPQLPGMLCFAVIGWLLARRSRHPTWIWTVPVIVAVWANLHGSFALGPALVGIAWLADLAAGRSGSRRLLALAMLSVGATAVTPFGTAVWNYALALSTNPTIRELIAEWQTPTLATYPGIALYGSLVLLAAGAASALRAGFRPRLRVDWPQLAWLAGLAAAAAAVTRGGAWWALGAPPSIAVLAAGGRSAAADIHPRMATTTPVTAPGLVVRLAGRISQALDVAEHPSSRMRRGAVIVALTVGLVALPAWRTGDPLTRPGPLLTEAPAAVTTALRANGLGGRRTFVLQDEASWFEFAAPGSPLFVDSRIELFPESTWHDYFEVIAGGPDWPAILDRWRVEVLVVVPAREPVLAAAVADAAAWRRTAVTADGIVYVRAST